MNTNELQIVLKAAIAMAQRDGKFNKEEAALIQHLLEVAGLQLKDVGGLDGKDYQDPEKAVLALGSVKAKRIYLLTMACVAMADKELDPLELEYFSAKAKQLEVGTIDLAQMTQQKAVATLERIIGEVGGDLNDEAPVGSQPSDIDLM